MERGEVEEVRRWEREVDAFPSRHHVVVHVGEKVTAKGTDASRVEISDREAALREIFNALKSGGILSVTEIIFDPHFQRRDVVLRLAVAVGFREKQLFGNRMVYTLSLEKPGGRN